MGDFIQSWAYVFIIIAFVVGWIAGFLLAIILAASGKGSRIEEKIQDSLKFEITTQGKPEDA